MSTGERTRRLLGTLCVCLALGLAGCGDGDHEIGPSVTSRAVLRGSQETPPVVTSASGTGTVTINGNQSIITISLATAGLADVTAAHLHVGDLGVPGPVILTLYDANTDGAFPATLTKTLTASDLVRQPTQGINTFADAVDAILRGETFLNVHTAANPNGEIRGQVGAVRMVASLSGTQEVPAVTTVGSGTATVVFDAAQSHIAVAMTASGLTSATAAHIQAGALGVTGPAIFTLFTSPIGAPSLTLTRTLTAGDLEPAAAQGISTFDDAVNAILSRNAYINVRTTANPNGEIRGQIVP